MVVRRAPADRRNRHAGSPAQARHAAKRRLAEAAAIERVSRAGGGDPARIEAILGPGFPRELRQLVRAAREQLAAEAAPPPADPAAAALARLRADPSRRKRV